MDIQARVLNKIVDLNNVQERYDFNLKWTGKVNKLVMLESIPGGLRETVLIEKSKNWVYLEGYINALYDLSAHLGI